MLIFVNSICFPETGKETSGIFVYEQCEELLRLGHQVIVLYPTYRSIKEDNCFKATHIECSMYGEFNVFKTTYTWVAQTRCPILSALIYSKYLQKCYVEAVQKYGKPDIIYAHFSLNAGFGAVMLGKKFSIPVVTLEHFSGFINGKINKRTKYLLNKVIDYSEQFLCVSDHLRTNIIKHTHTNTSLTVLPNMVNDIFEFSEKATHKEFIFFSVGSLIKRKNFDTLISLFSKTFSVEDNVKLRIAGEGEDKNILMELINKCNRKDQIILCGSLNRKQLLSEYQNCDAFVLLSKFETFGIVYREAMCVGRPIISTRNGGIEYNWNDAYGILVNAGDEEEIMAALKNMKNNIDRYDLQYISNCTTELYSSKKIGIQIQNIFKNVIQNFKNKN
ncbi:MAG: glycosyltransferase [Eubacterium sp.]